MLGGVGAAVGTYCVEYKCNYGEGHGGRNEADYGVGDGVFGFLDFGAVSGGGHVLDAGEDDGDYRNDAEGEEGVVDDVFEDVVGVGVLVGDVECEVLEVAAKAGGEGGDNITIYHS